MTRAFEHITAAIAAVLVMTVTFVPVVTVPQAQAAAVSSLIA